MVEVKKSAFEPSSPLCHNTKLCNILTPKGLDTTPILFLYTDGGPDHRPTYLSVQLSLTALFYKLDLDFFFYVCPPLHPLTLGGIQVSDRAIVKSGHAINKSYEKKNGRLL